MKQLNKEAEATAWSSPEASAIAFEIAKASGVFCGPAAVVWIAAVWNYSKNREYDYLKRLIDKKLFPDGPRSFRKLLPGFQINLNDVLMRETSNDLQLSHETYFNYEDIHKALQLGMPLIIRIPSASLRNGLHYVTLYKSTRDINIFRFYWQDNGVFESEERLGPGLSISRRNGNNLGFFLWGAKRVVLCQ